MRITRLITLLGLLLILPGAALRSPTYELRDFSFSAGGRTALTSPTYQVVAVSTGAVTAENALSSPTYTGATSFQAAWRPEVAVAGVRFADVETLTWDGEPAAVLYHLYRGNQSDFAGAPPGVPPDDYGECYVHSIPAATAVDWDTPSPGEGFLYYLVSAENRLGHEGPLGLARLGSTDADLHLRPNLEPCP